MARTGKEFLEGLRDGRSVWVDSERVDDVTEYPAFRGAAHTLAEIYDLQHEAAEVCLMEDGTNVSHLIPRSKDDVARRHPGLEKVAEYTVGLMGRTPDYLNVTFAGFAGRQDEWSINGNEEGAATLVAYQREMAKRDLCLTHTIIHPTVDKSLGDTPEAGNDVALRKVGETATGIVVRGARILATLAPFSDDLAVYPAHPMPEGSDQYALSFSIPMATPGLTFLCRDSASKEGADYPLSSRFDEQDAFVIFDDVEVPRDRLFIDANLEVYNAVMRTGWYPNVMQQTMIRAQTKLEFAYGLGTRMAEVVNDKKPATAEMLGELWTYSEFARACVAAAEAGAHEYGNGCWFPDGRPLTALRANLPQWFPRVNEILRLIGSHNLLAAPVAKLREHPEVGPLIAHHLRGAKDVTADERIKVFRLAWDFVGSALGARNEQYERFYLASGARNFQLAHITSDKERAARLVEQFL